MRPVAAAVAMSVLCTGCALEAPELPPLAEVEVVVDTDLDVERLSSRLQIDLYDASETWFLSREFSREDPRVWPTSFVLVGPKATDDGAEPATVLVRLRLYPDGKVRDYRGERFFSEDFLDDAPAGACLPLLPPDYGPREQKQLTPIDESGEPGTPYAPADEPLPDLTIDRLVPVRIEPGKQGRVRVRLEGACLGVMASFGKSTAPGDEQSCDAGVFGPAAVQVADATDTGPVASAVGTFAPSNACTAPPRRGDFQSFEDEVCLPGGTFLLGDPAVFAYGNFDGVPEHVAVVSPLRIDKFEVTVGRFRKAVEQGLLPSDVELPTFNDAPLAYDGVEESACTYSSTPSFGREAHPLNCVSWATARAFCKAIGSDLPTEAQWEYAAAASSPLERGARETRFAWGSSEPSCTRAVYARAPSVDAGATSCALDPADVGLWPLRENESVNGDRTPSGVVGMAGNVREFVLDAYEPYCSRCWIAASLFDPHCVADDPEEPRAVRGGDWASDEDALLVGLRNEGYRPSERSPRVGFRCVRPGIEGDP